MHDTKYSQRVAGVPVDRWQNDGVDEGSQAGNQTYNGVQQEAVATAAAAAAAQARCWCH